MIKDMREITKGLKRLNYCPSDEEILKLGFISTESISDKNISGDDAFIDYFEKDGKKLIRITVEQETQSEGTLTHEGVWVDETILGIFNK